MWDNLLESFLLLVVGMGGVFASLLFLAGLIWTFRFTDEAVNRMKIRRYARRVESRTEPDELNDEIVAVLAAAAAASMKKSVIIRRVRFIERSTAPTWASTGRLNIMASHAISRRKS